MSRELCDFVLSNVEGQRTDVTSVSLLCLPHVDRHTEVSLFVNLRRMPKVTLPRIRQLPSCGGYFYTAKIRESLKTKLSLNRVKTTAESDYDSLILRRALSSILVQH